MFGKPKSITFRTVVPKVQPHELEPRSATFKDLMKAKGSEFTDKDENIPLHSGTMNSKSHLRCECKGPCLHVFATTGDLDNLVTALDKIQDDTVFNSLDKHGRNVLHCAAGFKGFMTISLNCAKVILSHVMTRITHEENEKLNTLTPNSSEAEVAKFKKKLKEEKLEKLNRFVNAVDDDKYTPLYFAAKRENEELSHLLLKYLGDWDIRSWRGKTPAEKVFKKIPQLIVRLIEETTPETCEYVDGTREAISCDFGTIITYPSEADKANNRIGRFEELDYLSNICYTPLHLRMDILKQPLLKILIRLKWQKIKWFVAAARTFQIAWFLLYSIFLIYVYRHDCPYKSGINFKFHGWFQFENHANVTTDSESDESEEDKLCHSHVGNILVWPLLVTLTLDLFLIQLPPIRVRKTRYWHPMKKISFWKCFKRFFLFIRIIHAGKFAFLIIAFATLWPVLKANVEGKSLDIQESQLPYVLASVSVGLAWYNILSQIGKIPKFRVYIKMLTMVLKTLGMVLLIYSALIIAFAMVFCILLPGVGSYSSPVEAIFKMSTFLIGEINYDDVFYGENSDVTSASKGTTLIVFGVAVVILNIALLNFIIGLTVADIQGLKQFTETWENYSILWQIFLFDTFLSHFPIRGYSLLKKLMLFKPKKGKEDAPEFKLDIPLATLPKSLQKEIHALDLKVKAKQKDEGTGLSGVQIQN